MRHWISAGTALGLMLSIALVSRAQDGGKNDEPIDLYELIRRRYERTSTIVTSNRAKEEWPPLFGDPLLASAALDRLLHNAHVIEIAGDSYRNPPPGRRSMNASRALAEAAK